MNLVARRCTFSRIAISLMKWGLHNCEQYAKFDRTSEIYRDFLRYAAEV